MLIKVTLGNKGPASREPYDGTSLYMTYIIRTTLTLLYPGIATLDVTNRNPGPVRWLEDSILHPRPS